MKIALAQMQSVAGNIGENIIRHKYFISQAIHNNADATFFPELSLTGYEPSLAKELASTPDDSRFAVFQSISDENNIVIGVGMPIKSEWGICISLLIFQPGMPVDIYSKQHLHEDELPYFMPGKEQKYIVLEKMKIALAICYESLLPHHAEGAASEGMDLYLASVAKSANGVAKAYQQYPKTAVHYSIPVLMINCVGYCDNFQSTGSSAGWNRDGMLAGKLDENSEGILIYDTKAATTEAILTTPSLQ